MKPHPLIPILRYMLTWQVILSWVVLMGLLVLLLVPFAAVLIDPLTAYGLSIYGYVAALVCPFLAATVPFRHLIASRRLALVAGAHVYAGLALLLLTLLVAFFLPLSSALLWPGILHPQLGPLLFVVASVFTALMQWVLASRFMMLLLSFGPFLFFLLLALLKPWLAPLAASPAFAWTTFALCLAGWGLALWSLSKQRKFSPVFRTPFNNTDYLWVGTGWPDTFSMTAAQRIRSPAGTLLLAYPDGWFSRLYYTLNMVVVSPFVGTLILYLISHAGDINQSNKLEYVDLFLLFSMVSTILASMGNGELAARCRLVWMRRGGSRREQWRLLEKTLFTNLALLWITVAVIGLGALLLLEPAGLMPRDYLLTAITCSLLGSYFSLAARVSNWSMILQLLMVCVMGPGVAFGFLQDIVPLPLLGMLVVLLALLFRWQARRHFTGIDWHVVKPRISGRAENAG